MSRWLIPTLVFLLAIASCSQPQQKQPPAGRPGTRALSGDTKTDVRSFFDDYTTALNKSDSTDVLSMYEQGADVTLAGKGRVLYGRDAIRTSSEETIFNGDQLTFAVDSLLVTPLGPAHAFALVTYKVESPDEDLPAFHTVASYVLEKVQSGWQILHAHVSSDWVVE